MVIIAVSLAYGNHLETVKRNTVIHHDVTTTLYLWKRAII